KDVSDINHLSKVDTRKLKVHYGDFTKYPKLSERVSLPRIRDLKMSRNHNLVLTCDPKGNIFVLGLGNRGRLGLGHSQHQDTHTPIPTFKDENIQFADVSEDHNIVLNSYNEVYTWGSNNYGQLGYPVEIESDKLEPIVNIPKLVNTGDLKRRTGQRLIGVSCSKFHSLVYTKSEIYLWGLNIGQFGFLSSNSTTIATTSATSASSSLIQASPRKLAFSYGNIKQVSAIDSATIVLADTDEIHVYMNGFHTKIIAPLTTKINEKHFHAFKPLAISKKRNIVKLITQKNCLSCLILLNNGDILQFSLDNQSKSAAELQKNVRFSSVWHATKDHLRCCDVDMSNDGSIIISVKDGSVYKRIKRSSMKANTGRYKFSRIPGLNRVVKVVSDPTFSKFAFIRDEVDLIPHRLQKSSIFEDIERLSPLSEVLESQSRRIVNLEDEKKLQKEDTFKTDFIYRLAPSADDDGNDDTHFFRRGGPLNDDDETDTDSIGCDLEYVKNDKLYRNIRTRWTKNPKSIDSIKKLGDNDPQSTIRNLIKSDDLEYWLTLKELRQGKFYDYSVVVEDEMTGNSFEFGVHLDILALRCPTFNQLINDRLSPPIRKDGLVIERLSETQLKIHGDVTVRAVLIALHFLYTDSLLDVWSDWTSQSDLPSEMHRSKLRFNVLSRAMRIVNPVGKVTCQFDLLTDLERLRTLVADKEGCTKVVLKNSEAIPVYIPLMACRSIFFEKLLSDSWLQTSEIQMAHISSTVFEVILRYLHGVSYLSLLDAVEEIYDIPSLINFCLELIEIADELMLNELSDICQLYLKDFITIDNVDLLMLHALNTRADKLFENCVWFIYNNLDLLLFEPHFSNLVTDNLENVEFIKRLDTSLKWFHRLKYLDQEKEGADSFIECNSETLTKQFVQEIDKYNGNFLHPLLWEICLPLYISDVSESGTTTSPSSIELKLSANERRRRSSARRIEESKLNIPGAVELSRSSSSSTSRNVFNQFIFGHSNPSADSFGESVIEDDDSNDDFTIVRSKRNSSVRKQSDASQIPTGVSSATSRSASSQIRQSSPPFIQPQPQSSNLSVKSIPVNAAAAASSSSATASPSFSSAPATSTVHDAPQKPIDQSGIIKASTINMPRLSQRERKKQLKEKLELQPTLDPAVSVLATPSAPWSRAGDVPVWGGIPTSSSVAIPKPYNLPTIGSSSAKGSTSTTPVLLAPSFKSILLEEELLQQKKNQAPVIRSLEEAQQEEEFAQWWAAESARVQKELKDSENAVANEIKKTKGYHGRKQNNRKGSSSVD
ncbi:hypothetical protein CANARDRAFT_181096, partial [[Candida] arabinofermentans NRRL YB-2248]